MGRLQYNSLEGIPITEEWLEKAGFEFNGENKWIKEGFEERIIQGNSSYYMSSMRPELLYVHQLQNFYFAITGEELTLKELV